MDVQISFRGMDPSQSAEELVRDRAADLEQVADRIAVCRVSLEAPNKRHRHGDIYHVHVVLDVPGATIAVNHEPGRSYAHEDLYVAIRDAFDAARRRLRDHTRRLDGDVKRHDAAPIGHVVRMIPERDHGFFETTDEGEVYFHRHSVKGHGFEHLKAGDRVRYVLDPEPAEHGAHASAVFLVGPNAD